MTTDIRRLSIPVGRRIIAISDIHAHLRLLTELLEGIGFSKEDELFIVGDLLARGTENLATLRYLMELDKNDNVHVMMGNMEYWHCSLIDEDNPEAYGRLAHQIKCHLEEYGHSFYADMLIELGMPVCGDINMTEAVKAIRSAYEPELVFIRSLPVIFETDKLIFVHGGIPTEDLESLRGCDPFPFLKNDNFMEKGLSFSKYIIVGHWPARNYHSDYLCHLPYINHEQHIISIDGCCGIERGAQLNAFIISDEREMKYETVYRDGLPTRTAAEAQAESETFINMKYGDHAVTILEKGTDESYVEHKSSGYRLWVPNFGIWFEGGDACSVYSDYMPPVQKGDILSIVAETANGCLIKKNGLCGLYRGSFAD